MPSSYQALRRRSLTAPAAATRTRHSLPRSLAIGVIGLLGLAAVSGAAEAQDRRNEQFYYPGSFNWQFLANYPEAGRLFNAFDYGHAILYENLLTRPSNLPEELEKQYNFLTGDLLIRPPRFAIAEEVIEPTYAKLVWQARQMFDWAHLLHRQIFDVYADERLSPIQRDSLIERLTDYYLTRGDYAFRPVPKSMTLMDEQYYSQVFRRGYPKFSGLIWAYHWLQVGLYEPLIVGTTSAEKKSGVQATLARFWTMLEDSPTNLPRMMPMASAIAPRFSAAHPRAAVIFDNLHMMHDIIADILAADTVPQDKKRDVIYAALAEFRDTTRNVMSLDEWRRMGDMRGAVAAMGGPAIDLPPAGAVPAAPMPGMGSHPMPANPGAASPPSDSTANHPAMSGMPQGNAAGASRPAAPGTMQVVEELHARMMGDPVIRQRMIADTAMRRLVRAMGDSSSWGAIPAPDSSSPPRSRVTPLRQRSPAQHPPATQRDSSAKPMSPMPGMPRP